MTDAERFESFLAQNGFADSPEGVAETIGLVLETGVHEAFGA